MKNRNKIEINTLFIPLPEAHFLSFDGYFKLFEHIIKTGEFEKQMEPLHGLQHSRRNGPRVRLSFAVLIFLPPAHDLINFTY
jgi:hypothetical protein